MARICSYAPITAAPANDLAADAPAQLDKAPKPTAGQWAYLRRGLAQPGGKLPLFDEHGQRYAARTIQSCIDQGWAEPWFANPIKPDWTVCRLTKRGAALVQRADANPHLAKPRSA
jgi:hypothetical protein